ncbi:sensor histidine kinase KdpD [Desulfuromonas sp. TF]|uniref:sensor histidine kinase n=1 Tax=Desulfuromonas sp. TF TaxID=1232410 RepID=UPI000422A5F0|nr:HAMP domain-containing sensor histidine kinase [Desulfuromonas sp. TF]
MAAHIAKVIHHIPAKELKRRQISSISKELTHPDDLERLKREFISTASHELCTPLTSILGFSELLMNPENYGGIAAERQREFLEIIYEKARDLMDIVDALLILAHSRSGIGVCLNREACSIETLVEEALAALPGTTDKQRIEVHLVEGGTSIWIDRKKLGRALTALLANALKFAPDRVVRVRGECSGGRSLIAVEDDGIGMSPQDLKKIFQPFFRVDASSTAAAGLGLGLPFANALVEAHGGDLSIKSTPGAGTTVTLSIPLTSGSKRNRNH